MEIERRDLMVLFDGSRVLPIFSLLPLYLLNRIEIDGFQYSSVVTLKSA